MSDVTEAPTQDAIAESLLGTPEPAPQDAPQETTVAEGQTEEQVQPKDEQQTQPEETADDWLPTEQEKVFPDDVLARYAQRYQITDDKLADPLIRQLLVDKLNSDIYIRQQAEQPEPEIEQETQPQPEPTPPQPPVTREQYLANIGRLVESRTDPEVAKAFHADFLKAFGVPEAEIAKLPAGQAVAFTNTASKYMLNLVNTFLPDMLQATMQPILEQVFPEFGRMYERSAYAMAWDRVRGENQDYSTLPAYGTQEFKKAISEAAEKIPGFDEIQFTKPDGKPLSMMENAMRKYGLLARIASGKNVDPALLRQAAAAGAKNSRRAAVNRQAGNLGSGQSKSAAGVQTSNSRFQTNQDLFDEETVKGALSGRL